MLPGLNFLLLNALIQRNVCYFHFHHFHLQLSPSSLTFGFCYQTANHSPGTPHSTLKRLVIIGSASPSITKIPQVPLSFPLVMLPFLRIAA